MSFAIGSHISLVLPKIVSVGGTDTYEILPEVLGKGAFSEIRKARDLRTGAYTAGKFRHLVKDKDNRQKLLHETAVLDVITGIANRNIVQVFYISNTEKLVNKKPKKVFLDTCMMMEYMPRGNLLLFSFHQKLSLLQGLDIFVQCARAVEYLHGLNIAHLDIKPSNFLMDWPTIKGGPIIKLTDFDEAQLIDLNGTVETGQAKATLALYACPFMAPEFFSKREGTDSMRLLFDADIFSMAVTFLTIMSRAEQPTLSCLELGRYISYHGVFDVGACVYDPRGGEDIMKIFKVLLAGMLRENPRERPKANQVAHTLDWLYKTMI